MTLLYLFYTDPQTYFQRDIFQVAIQCQCVHGFHRVMKNGKPEIQWVKGRMDGVEIFVNRGEGYEPLAIDMRPPYIDTYELEPGETASFKYYAVYLKHDEHVGQPSDEVSITVSGIKAA